MFFILFSIAAMLGIGVLIYANKQLCKEIDELEERVLKLLIHIEQKK